MLYGINIIAILSKFDMHLKNTDIAGESQKMEQQINFAKVIVSGTQNEMIRPRSRFPYRNFIL